MTRSTPMLPAGLARLTAVALAVGGLTLAGCTREDRQEAKAKTDQAVETVKDKTREVAADVKQAGSEIKAEIKEAAADVKDKTREVTADTKQGTAEVRADAKDATREMRADASTAIDKTKVAISDATITASVKAELAKDDVLKARDINVDTDAGRVSLRGIAPTREARERATSLAQAVTGVRSVKNELTVSSS